jgi:hypothetical protein
MRTTWSNQSYDHLRQDQLSKNELELGITPKNAVARELPFVPKNKTELRIVLEIETICIGALIAHWKKGLHPSW